MEQYAQDICRSDEVEPKEGQIPESDTTTTIENLRGRLARRNDILDVIRKA